MSGQLTAGLLVVEPGPFATVQDLGRPGLRAFGVPVGGVFDVESHGVANALVGNDKEAATLEMTVRGGLFQADDGPFALALAGAALGASIRFGGVDQPLRLPGCFTLPPGGHLLISGMRRGVRAYLAVAGGWQTATTLGSRSTEQPINAGSTLPCFRGRTPSRWIRNEPMDASSEPRVLRILDGPDGHEVTLDALCALPFRVQATSNRVGVRLEGTSIPFVGEPERLSAPVAPGAVQIAGGQPIVLGVACGTMGGYPHAAHVITADLPVLAQLMPGALVRFARVGIEEAWRLDREHRESFARRSLILRCVARSR